jgi:hypothetical protein
MLTVAQIAVTNDCRDDVAQFVLQGLRMLSSWTTAVLEQAAWKFAHPTDKFQNLECTDDSQLYEKVCFLNSIYFAFGIHCALL